MNLTRACWLLVLLLLGGAGPVAVLAPSAGARFADAAASLRASAVSRSGSLLGSSGAPGAARPQASVWSERPRGGANGDAPPGTPGAATASTTSAGRPSGSGDELPADHAGTPDGETPDRAPALGCMPLPFEEAASPAPHGAAGAAEPLQPRPLRWHGRLAEAIDRALDPAGARYAVVVKRITDGCGAVRNPERVFYAASLFKLVLLYDLFYQREQGRLRFDEEIVVTEEHAQYALGPLLWPVGTAVPIADLAAAMITHSDNVAAIMVHKRLGGPATNARLAAAGLRHTQITTELPTTAADLALLLEGIARGQAVSPRASQEMLALLLAQKVNDRIPAGLPRGIPVAHKTGNWENACHDAAIVLAPQGAYVLVALSEEPACAPRVAKLSAAVYDVLAADTAEDLGSLRSSEPRGLAGR